MRYNLRAYTDTNSVICKIIVGTKASFVQRVDFPVSGENVCEADKRGLGVARQSRDGGIVMYRQRQSPSQKSKISASPLYTRGP